MYALAEDQFLVDDSDVRYEVLESLMELEIPENGPPPESPPPQPGTPPCYGCRLWLGIELTNTSLLLTLYNTLPGFTYLLWTNVDISQTNWAVATNLTGASGDFTQTTFPVGQLTNLFFRASGTNSGTNFVFAFQGLTAADTGAIKPDSMGAVSRDYYVELLNRRIAVYYKTGGPPVAVTDTTNFFRIGTNYPSDHMTDPRILYDPQSNRWVACSMNRRADSREIILAVSKTDDPSDLETGWTNCLLDLRDGAHVPDFPTLGLDGNGIYLTTLIQQEATNFGHAVVAFKKSEIYKGLFIMNRFVISNDPPVWTAQPAVNFDSVTSNSYAWFVAKGPPDFGTNYQGGAIYYRRLQWSNTTATLDTNWIVVTNSVYRNYYDLDRTGVSVLTPAGGGVPAPQSGGISIDLRAGSRLAMTVIRNGFLWTCQAIGLGGTNGAGTNGVYSGDETGTYVDRTGAQWLKLSVDAAGGTLSYSAHGRVYDPAPTNAFYYYFPSLMVNGAGDMVTAFSGSSATNYIGAYYAWLPSGGSAVVGPRLIKAGDNTFGDPNWGDYSATTLDPTDDCSFWTVQEHADPVGDWATVIAEIRPSP